jgi:mRNA-degrading endonuclease RelE of RelBE toxin-antitoxin system
MRIEFTRAAERALDNVDANRRRLLLERIRVLAANPRDPSLDGRPMQGRQDVLRLRVGEHRVLFRLNTAERVIQIEMIRMRGDVYKR